MGVVASAIYDKLAGDETLEALLSIYGGEPAIFSSAPVPEDASMPYVVIEAPLSDVPFDTKTSNGRELFIDIGAYAINLGSEDDVENIAERIRTLLHRVNLDVDGYGTMITKVSGITPNNGDDAYGRVITVRLIIQED